MASAALPILMIVDPPPPKILFASADGGESIHPKAGQLIAVKVSDSQSAGSIWIYRGLL